MSKKNKIQNMTKRVLKSAGTIKLSLFLFLALLMSITVNSQNCSIIDSTIITDVACYGDITGSIDLVLLNPAVSYTYAWSTVSGIIPVGQATNEDLTDLSPGIYDVIITETTAGVTCVQDTFFEITEPLDPLSSTVNLWNNVDCFGDSTGIAFADVIGGTPGNYTYLWSNGETTQIADSLWGDPSGPGVPFTHTVTFTDANGCTLVDSVDIINSHARIEGTLDTITHVSCFGACDGIAQLSSVGGVMPYDYQWDVGQVYSGSGPDTAYNLCFGGHSVIIFDALGCNTTIPFFIDEPDELFVDAVGNGMPSGVNSTQTIQCYGFNDGTAFAAGHGGTEPFSFV